jgi:Biopolymer transport protein
MDIFDPETADDALVDINTTPLIDVLLVLLIMLIVTIPASTRQLDLALPAESAAAQPPPKAVRLDLAAEGPLRWNGEALADRQALEARLQSMAALGAAAPDIHLRADPQASYGRVVEIMAALQRHKTLKFGIVDTGTAGGSSTSTP